MCADARRSRRCFLVLAATVLTAAALVLVVSMAPTVRAAGGSDVADEPVYLLNAMYFPTAFLENHAHALWLGIDCALYHANYTAAGGRPIEIIEPDPSVNRSDIVAVVKKALDEYPTLLGVIGPYSDPHLGAVLNDDSIKSSGVMFLAPFTGSAAVRQWNEQVYFTRAEPHAELLSVVKHVSNSIGARRTAFMYLMGSNFGDSEYKIIVELMKQVSLDPPVVYVAPFSRTGSGVNKTAFDAMADTRPQVIIVWGAPGQQVAAFLQAVLTDPRTSCADIISSSVLQQLVFQVYYNLPMAGKLCPENRKIMVSSTSAPLTEPNTTHIPMFRVQMQEYMAKTGRVNASLWEDEARAVRTYGKRKHDQSSGPAADANNFFHEHPNAAQLMLAGWLSGSLIVQTLVEDTQITDRRAYQKQLFEQKRYIIGEDFVLGDYGAPCDRRADLLGAVCSCNQGGHATSVMTLDSAAWSTIRSSFASYPQSNCYSVKEQLKRPLNDLTLIHVDYPLLANASFDTIAVRAALVKYLDYAARPLNVFPLNVTKDTVQADAHNRLLNYTVDIVTGVFFEGFDTESHLVPSPVFHHPHLVKPMKNHVYLMPTLEQQMFVLYANLATVSSVTSIGSRVHVILHGYCSDEAASITDVLLRSAATFDYDDPSVTVLSSSGAVRSALVRGSINFVLAVTAADVDDIVGFLAADGSAIVVVVFDDLMLQYTTLCDALSSQPASVQARVISFTNLPLWSDTSPAAAAASPALEIFHRVTETPKHHTPLMLKAVVTDLFVMHVFHLAEMAASTELVSTVYRSRGVSTFGMTFGSFDWGCEATATSNVCVYRNYGAQSIEMLSVQRMLDPRVPPVTAPMTPTMMYAPRTKSASLTPVQRNAALIGSFIGVAALIALCALIVYCCTDSRDNDAAPKDHRAPVTLVFTDIESSTALWAALPQLMTDAIAVHHGVIREVIRECKCYEVKTIGDSFMIACKDAHVAVLLACEIQAKLLRYDWGTVSIDGAYRDFELARAKTVDDYVPPTAQLCDEEYAALWRGLRVRMGIHTGLCDIRYDEVTKGYDYYGDTPNMAARTEAVANGGQVVATESTWWALSDGERASIAHTAMGPQGLRGVPFAVEMFQLDAVPGRRHAALRTEIEAILPDETASETGSSAAGALLSSVDTKTGTAAGVAFVLSSCFAPYPVAQRVRELQPLLTKWSVGAPPRSRHVSEEDYCRGLVSRLATRIATVSQTRQRMSHQSV